VQLLRNAPFAWICGYWCEPQRASVGSWGNPLRNPRLAPAAHKKLATAAHKKLAPAAHKQTLIYRS